jgi:hypothetical protein
VVVAFAFATAESLDVMESDMNAIFHFSVVGFSRDDFGKWDRSFFSPFQLPSTEHSISNLENER